MLCELYDDDIILINNYGDEFKSLCTVNTCISAPFGMIYISIRKNIWNLKTNNEISYYFVSIYALPIQRTILTAA